MKFHIPLIDLWKNYLYNISIAKQEEHYGIKTENTHR